MSIPWIDLATGEVQFYFTQKGTAQFDENNLAIAIDMDTVNIDNHFERYGQNLEDPNYPQLYIDMFVNTTCQGIMTNCALFPQYESFDDCREYMLSLPNGRFRYYRLFNSC